MSNTRNAVGRYTPAARANHWLTAMTLILLALSGLSLFHPALYFFSDLFGGGVWTRIIHPWLGLILLFSFAGLFLRFWRYNLWEREDTVWIKNVRDVVGDREEALPEVGRYNAGQKIVFWAMSTLIVLLFLSGIILWEVYFGTFFGVGPKRFAAVVHAAAAFIIVCIWIVHVYAAIWVKGTVRAMTRGSVTGGWAWKHHRKWLREETTTGRK